MITVAFITLGCPKNEVDTDKMRAQIEHSVYQVTDNIDVADIIVVNTCSFIQDATEESIETILEIADVWLPEKEDRHLFVSGCMVSRYGKELEDTLSEVSVFLPVVDEHTLCDEIERITSVPARLQPHSDARTVQSSYAYIMISDGCHRNCAYCTIPSIRGPFISKPLDEILSEVDALSRKGVSEFILIGQDTSEYGRDLSNGDTLIDVIEGVCALQHVARVRLMYLQPEGVTDALLETMSRLPKMCRYVEMPLQHCEKNILRSMNRAGDKNSFLGLIEKIRRYMPDVVLRTTLMVGYPGETDEDFESIVDFVETVEFDYVGIFAFSAEDGTIAATLGGQIDDDVKGARLQELRDIADRIGWSRAGARVGRREDILLEGYDEEGAIYGRSAGQAPDIDGVTHVKFLHEDSCTIGTYVEAEIFDSILYDLDGMAK
ncbi:MAG: 30S ribosomal protein S12 methylthiotransferase RimO [Coriobacteriia bacterium]|nr:30S ribosomal protein S12 methylthiotransferase RimO [Coriobacteriia bacterium]